MKASHVLSFFFGAFCTGFGLAIYYHNSDIALVCIASGLVTFIITCALIAEGA